MGGRRVWVVLALAALGLMVALVGPQTLWEGFHRVGPWMFGLLLAAQGLVLWLDSRALRLCAAPHLVEQGGAPWMRASAAALAVNTVAPMAQVGEAAKFAVLVRHLPASSVGATVLVYNVLLFSGASLQTGFALWLGVHRLPLAPTHATLAQGGAMAFTALGLAAFVALWLLGRRPQSVRAGEAPRPLEEDADEVPPPVSGGRWGRAKLFLSQAVKGAREAGKDPARLGCALGVITVKRILFVAELAVVLELLGSPKALSLGLLCTASTQLAAWVMPFVPGQAGAAEGSVYLVAHALGAAPALAITAFLVIRAKRTLFAVLLLGVLTWVHPERQVLQTCKA